RTESKASSDAGRRTPTNAPAALGARLRALEPLGLGAREAALIGMGHVPVAGMAHWSDDGLMPRQGPPFHMHQGNDVFADAGTPLRAPSDGIVRFGTDPLGGLGAYVTQPDGTYFYLAHMAAAAPGLPSGAPVRQGQVVGF